MINGLEAQKASVYGKVESNTVRTKGPFRLEIFRGDQTTGRSLEALRERVAVVYHQGFGIGIMQTAEEVRESMIKGGSIFIVSKGEKDVAISVQHIMRFPIPADDDRGSERWVRVMFTSSRLVLNQYQEKGIGRWTMAVSDQEYKPDFFAGRSQNPAIHLGWEGLPFTGEDRPIHNDYTGDDLRSRQFRAVMWTVAKRISTRPIDINTGLAEYVYKEGETRGYTPDLGNDRYNEIDQRMKDLGLVRTNGDTLYYVIERINPSQESEEQNLLFNNFF